MWDLSGGLPNVISPKFRPSLITEVEASRERYLTPTDLTEMLKIHPVEFIVADLGAPLKRSNW